MRKKGLKRHLLVLTAGMMLLMAFPANAGLFDWLKKDQQTEQEEPTAYYFQYNDTQIFVDTEAEPVLKALGDPEKTFEQDSCAYQGKDIIYTYPGFELGIYPVDGQNRISSVYILDDTAATPEGIKYGSTVEEVLKAYGDQYTEEFGVYRYYLGNSELSIYTTNGLVDGIEYQIAPVK